MSAANDLKRVESYQYPAEHVGHLQPHHITALEKFKQLCQSSGYYTPNGPDGPSHDDETLLRYLRARKWIPQDAFKQFKDTEDWRKENQLAKLYDTIEVEDYNHAWRLYPQWTGRRDKRGIPTYVFEVANLNTKAINAYEGSTHKHGGVSSKLPPKLQNLFALYENLTEFALPLCSQLDDRMYPETPVSQSSNIVDISGVGLKQFWNLKAHMQDASQLATAHYPETLDRIFIIGAPSFFPTVWGWVKRWFDPITVSKMYILSKHDMKSTLEEFMAPEDIPRKYGGTLDFEYGQLPNLDPKIEADLKWINPAKHGGRNTFPSGPIRLRKGNDGEIVATAVGSQNGRPREYAIASLPAKARTGQASLEVSDHKRQLALQRTHSSALDTHPQTPPDHEPGFETPPSDTETLSPNYPVPPASIQANPAPFQPAPGQSAVSRSAPNQPAVGQSTPSQTAPFQPAVNQPAVGQSYAGQPSTMSMPYRPANEASTSETRDGTSATRYEQQSATHADGLMAENTPNMRSSGDGDSHGVMEPNTVAQAPKEHPMPAQEEPQQSYLAQAQGLATQAYSTAAGAAGAALKAVGLSKEGEEAQESAAEETHEIPQDPAVDQAKEKNVEEFLRSQYPSEGTKNNQS